MTTSWNVAMASRLARTADPYDRPCLNGMSVAPNGDSDGLFVLFDLGNFQSTNNLTTVNDEKKFPGMYVPDSL
jgi:hypothetical protein